MQLLTDYSQWYDGSFDGTPPLFERHAFTRGGLPKRGQFRLFESLGLGVPRHGLVRELAAVLAPELLGLRVPTEIQTDLQLVVYLDELAHRGEGKRLLPVTEALQSYPEHYASVFHPPAGAAVTFRLVRLGRLAFWLRQEGQGDAWRSNRRDSERVLCRQAASLPNPIPRVLWAIDFLSTPHGLLAIDFNTAPELSTLGESGLLEPGEVAAELNHAAQLHPAHLRQF